MIYISTILTVASSALVLYAAYLVKRDKRWDVFLSEQKDARRTLARRQKNETIAFAHFLDNKDTGEAASLYNEWLKGRP
jgi:hypothetical protein